MIGELDILIASINLPLLPGDTKPANAGPPKLKPITALMQHKGGILVIILLRLSLHLVLILRQDLLLIFLRIRQREGRFQGIGVACQLVGILPTGQIVEVLIVVDYVLVAGLVLLLAA